MHPDAIKVGDSTFEEVQGEFIPALGLLCLRGVRTGPHLVCTSFRFIVSRSGTELHGVFGNEFKTGTIRLRVDEAVMRDVAAAVLLR